MKLIGINNVDESDQDAVENDGDNWFLDCACFLLRISTFCCLYDYLKPLN